MSRCKHCGRKLPPHPKYGYIFDRCSEVGWNCRRGHTDYMGYWNGRD